MSCKFRQRIVCIARDGSEEIVFRCANSACAKFMADVEAECESCPNAESRVAAPAMVYVPPPLGRKAWILADETLVIEREGWEPPAVPKGYRRKSNDPRSDDAWVFLSQYPPCAMRHMLPDIAICGKVGVKACCHNPGVGKPLVDLGTCQKCPLRV